MTRLAPGAAGRMGCWVALGGSVTKLGTGFSASFFGPTRFNSWGSGEAPEAASLGFEGAGSSSLRCCCCCRSLACLSEAATASASCREEGIVGGERGECRETACTTSALPHPTSP